MTTTKEELIRIKNNAVGKDGVQISTLMLHCICDMARDSLDWQTENARLKVAMDKYSEDEMLCNDTIERCAKVCESVYESYERPCDTWPEARPDALSGAEDCIRAIRALKEGNEQPAEAVPVALKDCPIGLFAAKDGELCLKTEYGNNDGQIDAYIVRSGEYFWGGTSTAKEQREVLVTPVAHPQPAQGMVSVPIAAIEKAIKKAKILNVLGLAADLVEMLSASKTK
jgi:hypothetical protein